MTEKDILRAMSGIDAALILDAEKSRKKTGWLKWAGVAAGFCLIVYLGFMMKIAFTGANAPGPTNFYYDSFAEMNAAIGKDTLYNDANTAFAESETVSISISCYEDENGNVDVRDPNQLKATLSGGGIRVSYYILFGKDNVKKSYIGGYEEQRLRREINGITVHYSKIYDGSYHSQAKFIYDGDLYVIDVTSKEDIHDIQNYIERILKEE
ncbi:MAG: hypothetical protein IJY97_05145 [Clostridia bacterium]|nr:hypothetical protein [Clostridia bacterium]